MKKILLMIMLLIHIFSIGYVYAETNLEGIIPPDKAGVSLATDEDLEVQEILVKNPYDDLNPLEKALTKKTATIWLVIGIVVFYLIIVFIVLKLTKKRWK